MGQTDDSKVKHRHMSEKWVRWLGIEVAVEYKACIYFFAILFFYSMDCLSRGVYAASLLHMAEMIVATYGMGYLQVLALDNFDEVERFGWRELMKVLFCSALYAGMSYPFGWFHKSAGATGIFMVYCIILYVCAYLANKAKRYADTKQLNALLRAYQSEACQKGGTDNGQCHRDEKTDEGLR